MSQILFQTEGAIGWLTFNRPEQRNAMTFEMYDGLLEVCDQVDANPEIRVLVLRGAGKTFVAGTDIAQFRAVKTAEDAVAYEARIDKVLDRLERVRCATIAQVQGVAAGGGCGIAIACDMRIATPDARFGVPIARTLGNCLSMATCARLVDMIGPARTKALILTATLMNAGDALSAGLVNEIVPETDIESVVAERARAIAGHAPLTIRSAKEMVRRIQAARRPRPEEGQDLITMCYTSRDFREGIEAFLAKRRPEWQGQ